RTLRVEDDLRLPRGVLPLAGQLAQRAQPVVRPVLLLYLREITVESRQLHERVRHLRRRHLEDAGPRAAAGQPGPARRRGTRAAIDGQRPALLLAPRSEIAVRSVDAPVEHHPS